MSTTADELSIEDQRTGVREILRMLPGLAVLAMLSAFVVGTTLVGTGGLAPGRGIAPPAGTVANEQAKKGPGDRAVPPAVDFFIVDSEDRLERVWWEQATLEWELIESGYTASQRLVYVFMVRTPEEEMEVATAIFDIIAHLGPSTTVWLQDLRGTTAAEGILCPARCWGSVEASDT